MPSPLPSTLLIINHHLSALQRGVLSCVKHGVGLLLTAILLGVVASSCTGNLEGPEALYLTDEYQIHRDSVVCDSVAYAAISSTRIERHIEASRDSKASSCTFWELSPNVIASRIGFKSASKMADALFAKGVSEIPKPRNALEVYLALPIISPDSAMEILRSTVPRQKPGLPPEGFPLTTLDPAWGIAAWEVYCLTGSESWLKEAYVTMSRHIAMQRRVLYASNSLMRGTLPTTYSEQTPYPSYEREVEKFQDFALAVNALQCASLEATAQMAARLSLPAREKLHTDALEMRENINELFWNPALSDYGSLLYGVYYPIPSTRPWPLGSAACILFNIATPEMASMSIETQASPLSLATAIASATAKNTTALIAGIGNVWVNTLLSRSGEWPTLLIRGIYGMKFNREGVTFNPCVPSEFPGVKQITNLKFHNSNLSITLRGTGTKIASFMIDSVAMSNHIIPADLAGNHRVEITLANNLVSKSKYAPRNDATSPARPIVRWNANHSFTIANYTPKSEYGIYINGVLEEVTAEQTYTFLPTASTQVVAVTEIGKSGEESFASPIKLFCQPENLIEIPSSSITPRRAPKQIKEKATASKYIELAARHNTRLTFFVNAPEEGEYFIRIDYSNAEPTTAMRSLSVDSREVGVLVCPPVRLNSWVITGPSSTLTVNLKKGQNKLALTYISHTILLHNIHLLKK